MHGCNDKNNACFRIDSMLESNAIERESTPEMNLHRLELTINTMEQVVEANKLLKMGAWFKYDKEHPCQTAACAFGYAALDPALQEEGLSIRAIIETFNDPRIINDVHSIQEFNAFAEEFGEMSFELIPSFAGLTSFEAAVEFYGITDDAVGWLFDPVTYQRGEVITPKHVIDRIRRVIAAGGERPDNYFV